jgi:O-methyltransferase involved in polyketide biosynthesis
MSTSPEHVIDDEKYHEIIPTAILTAYPRTFSDIPYSQEIFDELQRHYGEIDDSLIVDRLAVELEARSKLIDKLLAETAVTQVLELAAGFSSRGLTFSERPDTQYVELDLPDLSGLKTQIVSNITQTPDNLHIIGGNALRQSDFEVASTYFDTAKPLAIVNEGLLRYLTFEEKAQVATNIRHLLERFGGVWISGDGGNKASRRRQNDSIAGFNTTLMHTTKRNDIGNAFEDREHFQEFFGNLGFTVEFHEYIEVQEELSSPQKLGLTGEEVHDKLLAYASAIVFRLKD